MPFTLPALNYSYTALEPSIDARTMEIHHMKHHQAYINNVNVALDGTEWSDHDIETVLKNIDKLPSDKKQAVINNGGGHANHALLWTILSPEGGGTPDAHLGDAIITAFGSYDAFKTAFADAAAKRFGSGWAWLVVDADKSLKVISTANQDSPLMSGQTPILGLDVWEHAYYLNYQNRRPDYIAAFWKIVHWGQVSEYYKNAL